MEGHLEEPLYRARRDKTKGNKTNPMRILEEFDQVNLRKQSRLLALAQSLQQLSPERREGFARVIKHRSRTWHLNGHICAHEQKSIPCLPNSRESGHARTASEGVATGLDFF